MKIPTAFLPKYGQQVVALPTRSFNAPPCSTDLPIEVLQVDHLWRLFPIEPGNRLTPAKVRIEDATADPAQLEQWARELPGCNWGLATGATSGVFVLEMDIRSAGNALRNLCEDDWDWRQTLLMSAGDAGYAFFRWPAGRAMRRSDPAPGLRIRGERDCVLVPPSVSHAYLDPDGRSQPHRSG
ncbi:bifunctional DNA primase/polymerase [Tunturiibacter lichenicola]|uniref:bifunctional DNA primase/polymerase n=1 Tax=Tunturiibacter lichenicola TaxID=2051959 RepID=UPI003D9B9740